MGSSLLAIARTCWPLGLLAGLMSIWNNMETSLLMPYLYTRVQCCGDRGDLDSKYDITDQSSIDAIEREAELFGLAKPIVINQINQRHIPACALPDFPPRSKLWSGSPDCVNSAFVKDSSQHTVSINSPLQNAALMLLLPVGGAIADACGRHPVLVAYAIACMSACILYTLDAKLCHMSGDTMIFIAGMLLSPCMDPKDSILASAIVDLTSGAEGKASERNSALSLLWACIQAGAGVGLLLALRVVSLHVSSYYLPWLVSSCIGACVVLFAKFVVPETLPQRHITGLEWHMFNPLQGMLHALSLMCKNTMLIMLMCVSVLFYTHTLGYLTLHFSYLMQHGFSQEEALLPTMMGTAVQILSACVVARYGDNFSLTNRFIVANALWIPCYLVMGPFFQYLGHKAAYIATAGFCVSGSLYYPTVQAFVSAYVGEDHQAKCQSVVLNVSNIGGIIGPVVWSNFIYDATAKGFAETKPVLASLVLAVVCTCIAICMGVYEYAYDTSKKSTLSSFSNQQSYGTDGEVVFETDGERVMA